MSILQLIKWFCGEFHWIINWTVNSGQSWRLQWWPCNHAERSKSWHSSASPCEALSLCMLCIHVYTVFYVVAGTLWLLWMLRWCLLLWCCWLLCLRCFLILLFFFFLLSSFFLPHLTVLVFLSFCWRWRLVVELVGFAFLVGLCYLAVVIGLLLALVVCCWVVALVDWRSCTVLHLLCFFPQFPGPKCCSNSNLYRI